MAPPDPTPYGFTFAARAARQLDELPARVAVQIAEFVANRLVTNPRRIGKPLTRELAGQFSARIDSYRVLYLIDEDNHRIRITRVAARSDVYRP